MPKPKVTVVLPVYNGEKTLKDCLDSLMDLDFPKEEREIIVVDNNSTDKTKGIIQSYPVTYLFEPNRGRAWARNCGIKHASADFVAFIDCDCIATKNWLRILVDGISQDNNVAFCGGEIRAHKLETMIEKFIENSWHYSQMIGIRGEFEHDLPRVVTANSICRKKILEKVGNFDEDLQTCEDTELSWRIGLAGYEIRLIPEAKVYHQHIRSLWKFFGHYFEYGLGDRILFQKYRSFFFQNNETKSNKNSLFVIFEDITLKIYEVVFRFFKYSKSKSPIFLLMYIFQHASKDLGWLYTLFRQAIYGEKNSAKAKIPLEAFFNRSLTIHENGTMWVLNRPMTWFINNGALKLVTYGDFRLSKLNKVGAQIWLSMSKTGDLQETQAEMACLYNVSQDDIRKDVLEFISMLEHEEILKKGVFVESVDDSKKL